MTSLPDWLVERAALDEVAPASRGRIDRADARALAERIAVLRAANDAELAAHPVGPAVAQIEARVAAVRRRNARRRFALVGVMTCAVAAIALLVALPREQQGASRDDEEVTRVKGSPRLLAFRQAGGRAELLEHDTLVQPGDLIQLRYNGGGRRNGVIGSVDGAGVVTLHFPFDRYASTALAAKTAALPNSYALDDAPRFERFFFITADQPIDVEESLDALRALANRPDSATAVPELPAGLHQWSLRLRKPDRSSKHEDRHD